MCPQDCPSETFNKVLDLRTKRLEIETVIANLRKAVVELKKRYEGHMVREKNVDKDLARTEEEIERFQTDKQK